MRRTSSISNGTGSKDTIAGLLASLMEVVRTTVACECVYVRAMVIKALIWMQSPFESFDELGSIIASELSDPAWPAALLNDILLTLHARFKVSNGYQVVCTVHLAQHLLFLLPFLFCLYYGTVFIFFTFTVLKLVTGLLAKHDMTE